MKFQNSSIHGFKVMLCIKKRDERTDRRTDGRTDGQTNNPEAICPSNLFEVGGIISTRDFKGHLLAVHREGEVKKQLQPPESEFVQILTLLLLNTTCSVLANSVDPDQLTSEEANWSGSALFVIKYVNFYQNPRSSNMIGWELEVGMAS